MKFLKELALLLLAITSVVSTVVSTVYFGLALWGGGVHDGRIGFIVSIAGSVSFAIVKALASKK